VTLSCKKKRNKQKQETNEKTRNEMESKKKANIAKQQPKNCKSSLKAYKIAKSKH